MTKLLLWAAVGVTLIMASRCTARLEPGERAPDPLGPTAAPEPPACGIAVRVLGGTHGRVDLELRNVSDERAQVGPSTEAAFVDRAGNAMRVELVADDGEWFMPISLPARSRTRTRVHLAGGDASQLDRIEIPRSGSEPFGDCTVEAHDLAR